MTTPPAKPRPRAWAVIPVHNRRETTLAGLRHLRETDALAWLRICVVDDGSTDGTGDAVRAEFPDATLLRGDGNLWWTGAIVLGMKHALAGGPTDALFWLNDDCRPARGALERLLATAMAGPCIALAQIGDETGILHGGLRKRWHGLELAVCPPDEILAVDTMNGNCVCLPATVAAKVGLPDAARFPQACGDTDYGLRCRRVGVVVRVVGAAQCVDAGPADPARSSWLRGDRSVAAIARSFLSPKNYFHLPSWWRFNLRHWGLWGVVLFVVPYLRFAVIALIRAVIPAKSRRRLFGPARP